MNQNNKRIFYWLLAVYLLVFTGFVLSVLKIMILTQFRDKEEWLKVAEKNKPKNITTYPVRGNIYTCDNQLWSTSISYYTLYMDTQVPYLHTKKGKKLFRNQLDDLCNLLAEKIGDKSAKEYKKIIGNSYYRKIYPNSNRHYARVVRLSRKKVNYMDLQEIKQYPIFKLGRHRSGFHHEDHISRVNLFGDLASRTVGKLDDHKDGLFGLEKQYNTILKGESGISEARKIGRQKIYTSLVEPKPGGDIVTTMDIVIQDITTDALRQEIERNQGEMGCAIVMDVKTGQIKACSNLMRSPKGNYYESYNMAFAAQMEPGSTFKTISMMVALEEANVHPHTTHVDTENGKFKFFKSTMYDHNWRRGGYGDLTYAEAFAKSSNIGISRMTHDLFHDKPTKYLDAIKDLNIFKDLNLEIPGYGIPVIPDPRNKKSVWSGITLEWMSVGYSTSIPPIYMCAFYNAIANNGKLMRPYLVKSVLKNRKVVEKFKPEVLNSKICSNRTLDSLQLLLREVVTQGTGKTLNSKYVSIAGKSGTAQVDYNKKGTHKKYLVSFCGYFPAENPQYTVMVSIFNPTKGYPSGGHQAGGVVRNIAQQVYAQKDFQEIDTMHCAIKNPAPSCRSGQFLPTEMVCDQLDLNINTHMVDFKDTDWISVSTLQDTIEMKPKKLIQNLVPNVYGMGATDAVYLIEKTGMKAQIVGSGRVYHQSILPGTRRIQGATVILKLK